ncbi:uncharacterized protein LOC111386217, partial [Olea europaea var. sylvestris]|uniref:uncharacterized protein LOC111386217 n=1 Tax=Olea europaea var. sylvestris TaxID=158386 RepID=UPI000C1D834E
TDLPEISTPYLLRAKNPNEIHKSEFLINFKLIKKFSLYILLTLEKSLNSVHGHLSHALLTHFFSEEYGRSLQFLKRRSTPLKESWKDRRSLQFFKRRSTPLRRVWGICSSVIFLVTNPMLLLLLIRC